MFICFQAYIRYLFVSVEKNGECVVRIEHQILLRNDDLGFFLSVPSICLKKYCIGSFFREMIHQYYIHHE